MRCDACSENMDLADAFRGEIGKAHAWVIFCPADHKCDCPVSSRRYCECRIEEISVAGNHVSLSHDLCLHCAVGSNRWGERKVGNSRMRYRIAFHGYDRGESRP